MFKIAMVFIFVLHFFTNAVPQYRHQLVTDHTPPLKSWNQVYFTSPKSSYSNYQMRQYSTVNPYIRPSIIPNHHTLPQYLIRDYKTTEPTYHLNRPYFSAFDRPRTFENLEYGTFNNHVDDEPTSKITAPQFRYKSYEDSDNIIGPYSFEVDDESRTSTDLTDWGKNFPECKGKRQSPIDINTDNLKVTTKLKKLKWNFYDAMPKNMTIRNTGHSVAITASWDTREGKRFAPSISGGPLCDFNSACIGDKQYVIENVHFHWGAESRRGSEHTINGIRFPMEMHVVHYRNIYKNFQEASKQKDGLAVVAYFFRISKDDGPISLFVNELSNITSPEQESTNIRFPLDKIVMKFKDTYAFYKGSLTTPPCDETVTWIISTDILHISENEISKFRQLRGFDGRPLVDNFREIQKLNGRTVSFVLSL